MSTVLTVSVVSASAAALFVLASIADVSDERAVGVPYVAGFEGASGIDLLLASGDGQAYAAIARDPSMSRPEVLGGPVEAAYRAQRPVVAYSAWILSAGQREAVPGALVVVAIIGAGLAGAGAGLLLLRFGVTPWAAVGIVALPGAVASLGWLHPELTGLGLSLLGVAFWLRGARLPALVLLTLAGLTRETLLLIPATMLGIAAVRRERRDMALMATPFIAWGAWAVIVRIRYGAWFFELPGDFLELPFVGIVRGLARWGGDALPEGAVLLGTFGVALAALMRSRDRVLRGLVAVHLVLASMLWGDLWQRWQDFSRVLLPLTAFSIIALLGTIPSRSQGKEPATSG